MRLSFFCFAFFLLIVLPAHADFRDMQRGLGGQYCAGKGGIWDAYRLECTMPGDNSSDVRGWVSVAVSNSTGILGFSWGGDQTKRQAADKAIGFCQKVAEKFHAYDCKEALTVENMCVLLAYTDSKQVWYYANRPFSTRNVIAECQYDNKENCTLAITFCWDLNEKDKKFVTEWERNQTPRW